MDLRAQGGAPSPSLSPEFVMDSTTQDENPTAFQADLFHDILGVGDYLNQTEPEGHGYMCDSEAGTSSQIRLPGARTVDIDMLYSSPFVPTQDNGQSYQEPAVTATSAQYMGFSVDEQLLMGTADYVPVSDNDNIPHIPLISTVDYDALQAQIPPEYQYQSPTIHANEVERMAVDRNSQNYRLTTSPSPEIGDFESALGVMDQYRQFSETDPWTPYSVGGPASPGGIAHTDMPYSSNSGNSIGVPSGDQNTGSNIEESTSPVTSNGAYLHDTYLHTTLQPLSPNRRGSIPRGSASPSSTSMTNSSARTVACGNCDAAFSGTYSRGNLARHIRLKHGSEEKEFPCSVNGCLKEYKRKDALLKHLRKVHPELGRAAPVPRSPNPHNT